MIFNFFLISNYNDFFLIPINPGIYENKNIKISSSLNEGSWILNCFFSNLSDINGAAISYSSTVKLLCEKNLFSFLTTSSHGGALYCSSINIDIIIKECCFFFCQITSNTHYGLSFFISNSNSKITLINLTSISNCCPFSSNIGVDSHYIEKNTPKIFFLNSSYNYCNHFSGLSILRVTQGKVNFSTFYSNIAKENTILEYWGGDSITENSNIVNNTQWTNNNGIVYVTTSLYTGNSLIKNCNFYLNGKNRLFCLNNGQLTLDNCFFDDYSYISTSPIIINSKIFQNTIYLKHFMTKYCLNNLIINSNSLKLKTQFFFSINLFLIKIGL